MVQPTTAQEGGAATNSGLLGTWRGFRAPSQSVTQAILPGGAPSLNAECDVSGDGSSWKDIFLIRARFPWLVRRMVSNCGMFRRVVDTHTKPPPP
jgi:hypothetical protein